MTAKIVRYWDFDENAPVTCPGCGWTGSATESSRVEYADLFEISCPKCRELLVIVPFPTLAETRTAAAAGNERAVAELPKMLKRVREARDWWRWAETTTLRGPEDLPELPGENLVIDWDFEAVGDQQWTVLRHGDTEVWREAAFWEGLDRFVAVAGILQRKYGARLVELRPTPASEPYLWGDARFGVQDKIDAVNAKLRGEG